MKLQGKASRAISIQRAMVGECSRAEPLAAPERRVTAGGTLHPGSSCACACRGYAGWRSPSPPGAVPFAVDTGQQIRILSHAPEGVASHDVRALNAHGSDVDLLLSKRQHSQGRRSHGGGFGGHKGSEPPRSPWIGPLPTMCSAATCWQWALAVDRARHPRPSSGSCVLCRLSPASTRSCLPRRAPRRGGFCTI